MRIKRPNFHNVTMNSSRVQDSIIEASIEEEEEDTSSDDEV